jgi:hypothetical protein
MKKSIRVMVLAISLAAFMVTGYSSVAMAKKCPEGQKKKFLLFGHCKAKKAEKGEKGEKK